MPGTELDELLDAYGGELTSGHYGAAVISTVDDVMGNPGVLPAVSPITMASIAALEVAAYEVLSGGDTLEALANLAIATATDLAGQLAAEALEAVGSVLPIMATAFEVIVGLQEGAQERARAERIAQARAEYQSCVNVAETWQPIGTGPFGEIYPCDLFVLAEPVEGGWSVHNYGPRMPYLGQMLRLVAETRWPGWTLHYLPGGSQNPAARPSTWGYADGPIWRSLFGNGYEPFKSRAAAAEWFPETDWYQPEFRRLREAITRMHPYERERRQLPPGDGGKSLWALYQDLLYATLNVPRHPFTRPGETSHPIKDRTNFVSWVPPLPQAAALALYGGGIERTSDGQPYMLGIPNVFRAIDYVRSQGGHVPNTLDRARVVGCGGQPTKALEAVIDMASDWHLYAHPRHYTDQQAQQQAIAKAAQFASDYARGRLRRLGLSSGTELGRGGAVMAIHSLANAGVISDRQATEAAQAVSDGGDPGKLPLYLGAAAVGAGALAWVLA